MRKYRLSILFTAILLAITGFTVAARADDDTTPTPVVETETSTLDTVLIPTDTLPATTATTSVEPVATVPLPADVTSVPPAVTGPGGARQERTPEEADANVVPPVVVPAPVVVPPMHTASAPMCGPLPCCPPSHWEGDQVVWDNGPPTGDCNGEGYVDLHDHLPANWYCDNKYDDPTTVTDESLGC